MAGQYGDLVRANGFDPASAVFRRIFLSDIVNQPAAVRESPLVADSAGGPVAVSLVQQPPLPTAKVALLAYHVDGDATLAKRRLGPAWSRSQGRAAASVEHRADHRPRPPWRFQLRGNRDRLQPPGRGAGRQGGVLEADCLRTWFFVKGVDVFYQDLVDCRNAIFARHGLTMDTHYLASTGIEGACGGRYEVVGLDAYSVIGLQRRQVSYLNALELIGATHDYGVAFERGTRVAYADRAHSFISGTASIDPAGNVVHPGDVLRQLDRALVNVEGLLRSGGATLADMMHLTVYLRDLADCAWCGRRWRSACPGCPCWWCWRRSAGRSGWSRSRGWRSPPRRRRTCPLLRFFLAPGPPAHELCREGS